MSKYYDMFQNDRILNQPRVLRTLRFITDRSEIPRDPEAREKYERKYFEVVSEITKIFVNQKDLEGTELKKAVSNLVTYLSSNHNKVYVVGNTSFGDVLSYQDEHSESFKGEDNSKELLDENDYSDFFQEETEDNPLSWDNYILTQNKTVQDLRTMRSFLESLKGRTLKSLEEDFSFFTPLEHIVREFPWELRTLDELPMHERSFLWKHYYATLVSLPRKTKEQITKLERLLGLVSSYPEFFKDAGDPPLESMLSSLKEYYNRSLKTLEKFEEDTSKALDSLLYAYFSKNYLLAESLMAELEINEEQLVTITNLIQVRHELLYYLSQAIFDQTEELEEIQIQHRMINALFSY